MLIPDVVSCMFFFLLPNLLLVFLGVVCTHNLEIFHSIKTEDGFFFPLPGLTDLRMSFAVQKKTILVLFCIIFLKRNFVLANQLFDNSCCYINAVTFCKCIMGNYERSDLKAQLRCSVSYVPPELICIVVQGLKMLLILLIKLLFILWLFTTLFNGFAVYSML